MILEERTQSEPEAVTEAPASERGFWSAFLRVFLGGLAVAVLLLAAAVVVVPRVIGAVPLTILTGSMQPTYNPGDVVVSKQVDGNTVRVGNVVTFQPHSDDPTLITHRVIAKGGSIDGYTLTTQGDANDSADEPISVDQVRGVVIYSVPFVGYVTQLIPQESRGAVIAVVGIALLGISALLIFRRRPADAPERTRS